MITVDSSFLSLEAQPDINDAPRDHRPITQGQLTIAEDVKVRDVGQPRYVLFIHKNSRNFSSLGSCKSMYAWTKGSLCTRLYLYALSLNMVWLFCAAPHIRWSLADRLIEENIRSKASVLEFNCSYSLCKLVFSASALNHDLTTVERSCIKDNCRNIV